MKNNRVTISQYWLGMIVCSFYAVIFTDNTASFLTLLLCAAAVAFNLFVERYYSGEMSSMTRVVLIFYFIFVSVLSVVRFNEYMFKSLGYGPYLLITPIMLIFAFFCAVKGLEPVARAGGIVLFFLLAALVYIFVCCFNYTTFTVTAEFSDNFFTLVVLLFPSASYVWFYNNIIPNKNYTKWIYTGLTLGVVLWFMCVSAGERGEFPFQRVPEVAKIGVFRGADCMLLELLTVGGLFIFAAVQTALFGNSTRKYSPRIVYLLFVGFVSLLCLYFEPLRAALYNNIFAVFLILVFVLTVSFEMLQKSMNKNS